MYHDGVDLRQACPSRVKSRTAFSFGFALDFLKKCFGAKTRVFPALIAFHRRESSRELIRPPCAAIITFIITFSLLISSHAAAKPSQSQPVRTSNTLSYDATFSSSSSYNLDSSSQLNKCSEKMKVLVAIASFVALFAGKLAPLIASLWISSFSVRSLYVLCASLLPSHLRSKCSPCEHSFVRALFV